MIPISNLSKLTSSVSLQWTVLSIYEVIYFKFPKNDVNVSFINTYHQKRGEFMEK